VIIDWVLANPERDYHRPRRFCLAKLSQVAMQAGADTMAYDVPPPEKRPGPGYYYHFKHDPAGPLNNYAYYIYGVGHHTEDNCPVADAFMQVYLPLYENSYAYRNGGLFDLRPLLMFYEPAIKDDQTVARFTKIT